MFFYNTREHRVTPETDCVFESESNQNLRRSRTENPVGKISQNDSSWTRKSRIPARIMKGLLGPVRTYKKTLKRILILNHPCPLH